MRSSCYCVLPLLFSLAFVCAADCVDGVHNKFYVASVEEEKLPVIMKNLVVTTYDYESKPACVNNKANIVLPGFVNLSFGEVHVPMKYDLKGNTILKMSAISREGGHYCKEGESKEWFVPSRYCVFDLCSFIGDDLCAVLEKPGVHTIDELVEKVKFNPKLELPSPPCLLVACLTDFFAGDWTFEFFMEYKGKRILRWRVPANDEYLQVALDKDEEDANDD